MWTLLYLAMGYASFRIWYKGGGFAKVRIPLGFYALQLLLNWLWTPIFFGAQELGWSFVEICLTWVFIVITTFIFYRVDNLAGSLMLPYIAWVLFASILNYSLWYLNR